MSYQKTQGYVAIEVLVSDFANIPYPGDGTSGKTNGQAINELVDEEKDFFKLGIKAGDIVYNLTQRAAATVVGIPKEFVLRLNSNIMLSGDSYIVYPASPTSGAAEANNGCVLYVGKSGDLTVTTIAGSKVSFRSMPVGFVPVQVKQIWQEETTADGIIGLW